MRTLRAFLTLALVATAASAAAQATKTPPTTAPAPGAKAADTKTAPAAGTKAADTKTAQAPGTKAPDTKGAATGAKAPAGRAVAPAPTASTVPVVMREVFAYQPEGRRDPFFSLLNSAELRPTIADLKLTGIIYDEQGTRSIAVMRDIATNEQYRARTGSILGRLRVALIKRNAVIFSIEEFGANRQDSLVLGDTTKVRGK